MSGYADGMSTPGDDEALSWEGDDDPTLAAGRTGQGAAGAAPADSTAPAISADPVETAEPEPLALPDGYTAVGARSEDVGHIEKDGTVVMPGDAKPASNAMLVTVGIMAGVFLLYTIGWIIGGLRLQDVSNFLVGDEAFLPYLWLAIAAPALWFGTVYLLTRRSAAWIRITWFVVGVLLLVPWPLVILGRTLT